MLGETASHFREAVFLYYYDKTPLFVLENNRQGK